MAGKSLSKASPYEQMFRARHRGPGRPTDVEDQAPVFVDETANPILVKIARRRAYAVLHEEYKERMRELFKAEIKVLKRRDFFEVLEDARVSVFDGPVAGSED